MPQEPGMSPNGLFPLHPVARVEPRYQPPRPGPRWPMSGADNVRSTPAADEGCIHSVSGLASASFHHGRPRPFYILYHPVFLPVGYDALPFRAKQSSRGSCGGCCLSAAFSRAAKRVELRVTIHKMAAPPVYAGNTTICAIRFKERCAITSGRGCRARRRGRDNARGSLWRGTSAGVCGD